MMNYDLSACAWQLRGYYPWIPLKERSMETGKALDGVTDWLPATVPGGVHLSLYRAGLIPHPYRDMNSLCCEWVENRWWLYRTEIDTAVLHGSFFRLIFEGIDYAARIYVNGRELCRHVGMFEPVCCDITGQVRAGGMLRIGVLIEHAPDENGQIGHTSRTFTQKSRFGYKWDFGTRLVNLGIWQGCHIACEQAARLENLYVRSDLQDGVGLVCASARLGRNDWGERALTVRFRLERGDFCAEETVAFTGGEARALFRVPSPALWYPNGYGGQPLYELTAELLYEDEIWSRAQSEIGIRSLSYRQNPDGPPDALPYTFVVNGEALYIRGVNLTPLDHAYGDVTEAHYRHVIRLMREMHVNLVRVWGGGIIETEAFYRACDRAGILVWQEFIQSSSGLDNVPSKQPAFLDLLRRSAVCAIESRRSHTCLAVWSGGNELRDESDAPATAGDSNIAMLETLVKQLDPQRLFLPTSATGPREFISEEPGMSHDVHGHWNYVGNPGHYALFGHSDNLFHSEFGCEGMCSANSLKTYLSEPNRLLCGVQDSAVYRHHGEWWCTLDRDRAVFGEIGSLGAMRQCGQWMQAEGLRFIVEANRRRAGRNSGSIIWQFNEPWPNVFCTNLVDFEQEPRMAYFWCRTAYAPVTVSLDYPRLDVTPGGLFSGLVHVPASGPEAGAPCEVNAAVFLMDGTPVYQRSWHTQAGSPVGDPLAFSVPADLTGMLLVRLCVRLGGRQQRSEYFFGAAGGPVYQEAMALGTPALRVCADGGSHGKRRFLVENVGSHCALHVHPRCENGFDLVCGDAFLTLLPGETKVFDVQYSPAFSSGFLLREPPTDPEPDITFHAFGEQEA